MLSAQTPLPGDFSRDTGHATDPGLTAAGNRVPDPLASNVFPWDQLAVTPTKLGVRRDVLDGSTTTLDLLHCHITTLNPGERSGEARLHRQEEIIIVKEGTVEANFNGQVRTAGPGSVIFFAALSTTFLRNVGTTPATYTVIYYHTPLTPKG
jgi:mannose-6-phosphate isomerase-like protein (cupin superfamily)